MDNHSDNPHKEENEKDNLITTIIEKMRKNQNYSIRCKIIKDQKEKSFTFMTINLCNIDYTQFIRKKDSLNLENKEILFHIKDIKFILLKGKHYFYIKQYEILKHETCELKNTYIYNSINEMDNAIKLFTIKLKAKEISDSLIKTKFIFQDLYNNSIKIKNDEDYEFENGKIYLFNGYLYDKTQQKLQSTMISSIQEYSNDKNKINLFKDIRQFANYKLVSFKCKIKSFSLIDKFVIIEDSDEKKYKVKLNYILLKKISLNGTCYFFNFFKTKDDEFEMTNFSDIEFEEETSIVFIFDNFDINKNHYNSISINKKHYVIDKKIMNIKVDDNNKNNIFIQDFYYERIENGISVCSAKFSLEVEKGKINNFHSLLGDNGGHSYQFYFQARYKEDLPKNISIYVGDVKYDFDDPDKSGNNLIERFTIINIPEQDINKLIQKPKKIIHEKYNDKSIIDSKYLIFINDKHEKDYKIFMKKKCNNKKEEFQINENEFKIIQKIFIENITKDKIKNFKEVLSPFLLYKTKKDILDILNILNKGFKKYKFKNTRHDYEAIKYLSFIELCLKSLLLEDNNNNNVFSYFYNFKEILNSIINLEYIDRIKVLLGFISNFKESIKIKKNEKILIDSQLELFNLDDGKSCKEYPYIKQAYSLIYEIIDNMKEECPLYQGISKLNSIIYKDIVNNNYFHSGSLLNVDDIKLELIKNINRFLFLSFKKDIYVDDYAKYDLESKTKMIYILSIFKNRKDAYDKKYFRIAASVISILLIHESFGHEKKNINNDKILTPRDHNDNNFQGFSLDEGDSGDVLEYLLINASFNIGHLMKHNDTEKLLNANLYIDNNFEELRKIYKKIEDDINIKEVKNQNINQIKQIEEEEEKEEEKEEEEEEEEKEEEEEQEKEKGEEENVEKEEKDEEAYILEIKKYEKMEIQNEEKQIKEQKDISIEEKNNDINEEIINSILFEEKIDNNLFHKKKKFGKKSINEEPSPPKQKRLLFRDMKRIYGKMTKEEKKNLKDDENYKRYLKLLKYKKVKY